MVTQLHLALVMAIDARLLVLDEPTLGLDILYRKQFYDSLLNDYFDRSRTIVVTTHQVEEVEHVLTDLMFINRGRIVFNCPWTKSSRTTSSCRCVPSSWMQPVLSARYTSARLLGAAFSCLITPNAGRSRALGDVRTPSIADLFVAVIGNQARGAKGTAQ